MPVQLLHHITYLPYAKAFCGAWFFNMPDRDLFHYLYKCSGAGKAFPEIFGDTAFFFLFKDTVEIGDIMKAAFKASLAVPVLCR
jgi:hypothetical protein